MKKYTNRLRKISTDEPIFFLPPFKVTEVMLSLSETIDWGVEMLNIPNFWKHTKGKNVNVAVLDTGIALDHPDLKGAIIDYKDFTNSPNGVGDARGHGTHVAGIIAARQNTFGIVGVAPECNLLVGKVLNNSGAGTSKSIVEGIKWAIESGADVINMSFGSNAHFPNIQKAIEAAIKKNIFVICAAGNDGPKLNTVDFPANYEPVIAVGAINRKMQIPKYVSRGRAMDIIAPGDDITSTYPPNSFAKLSGTSMAAPFVAGVTALVISKHRQYGGSTPLKTQKDLMAHLKETAVDMGLPGFDPKFGFGLIDPEKLLKKLKQ